MARKDAVFSKDSIKSLKDLYRFLALLAEKPPLSLRECARRMGKAPASMQDYVATVENELQFNVMCRNADGTTRHGGLTEKGHEYYQRLKAFLGEADTLANSIHENLGLPRMRIGGTNTSIGLVLPIFLGKWTNDLSKQVAVAPDPDQSVDTLLARLAHGELDAVLSPPGRTNRFRNKIAMTIDLAWGLVYAPNTDRSIPKGDQQGIHMTDLPRQDFLLARAYQWFTEYIPHGRDHAIWWLPSLTHAISWTRRWNRGVTIGHALHVSASTGLVWKRLQLKEPPPVAAQVILYVPERKLDEVCQSVVELIIDGMKKEKARLSKTDCLARLSDESLVGE